MSHSAAFRTSVAFLLSAAALLFVADLGISTLNPWAELGRMLRGILTPSLLAPGVLAHALGMTVAFAFAGVALGAGVGFCLATVFHPPGYLALTGPHVKRVESRKGGPPAGLAIFGGEENVEKLQ